MQDMIFQENEYERYNTSKKTKFSINKRQVKAFDSRRLIHGPISNSYRQL